MKPLKVPPVQPIGYSRNQAAAAVPCCLRTLDELIASGQLASYRIGRSVRVPIKELEKFIAARTSGGVK